MLCLSFWLLNIIRWFPCIFKRRCKVTENLIVEAQINKKQSSILSIVFSLENLTWFLLWEQLQIFLKGYGKPCFCECRWSPGSTAKLPVEMQAQHLALHTTKCQQDSSSQTGWKETNRHLQMAGEQQKEKQISF